MEQTQQTQQSEIKKINKKLEAIQEAVVQNKTVFFRPLV
jgi:hypothetical protein